MNLVDRAKNIILTPKTEWPVIAAEDPNVAQILTGYVLPLALIPAVASILGHGFIGRGFGTSLTWGIAMGLAQFISAFVGVYLTAYVADFLAPNFGSQKNLGRAVQLVAYSYTPGWVAGALHIIPALGILVLLAMFYGIYLLYLGLPHTMKTPPDKVGAYLVVLIVVLIVIYIIISAVLTPILLGLFGLSPMSMMRGM